MTKKSKKYIGYSPEDYASPYGKYFLESVAPISAQAKSALSKCPHRSGLLPPVREANRLLKSGYDMVESGFCIEPDGSIRVAVLTPMPGVVPYMWDWWFGWHGSQDNRYKLWHPKAHRSAEWKDGRSDIGYIGRTSLIEEYIGNSMEKASIQFVRPSELGFDEAQLLDSEQTVVICARLGYTQYPLDFGWLVHQIRAVEGGSEMRSRFWLGGPHIQVRSQGIFPNVISKILQKTKRLSESQATNLFIHCSEEMSHLATFLPQLYAEMTQQGKVIK